MTYKINWKVWFFYKFSRGRERSVTLKNVSNILHQNAPNLMSSTAGIICAHDRIHWKFIKSTNRTFSKWFLINTSTSLNNYQYLTQSKEIFVFSSNTGKYRSEKLRFQRLFTQWKLNNFRNSITQPAITCSELTTETLEHSKKYIQS